jgi:hypothetical protein
VKKYCVHDVTLAWAVVGREWTRRERTAARGDESVTTCRKMDATGRQERVEGMNILMRANVVDSHGNLEVVHRESSIAMFGSFVWLARETKERRRQRGGSAVWERRMSATQNYTMSPPIHSPLLLSTLRFYALLSPHSYSISASRFQQEDGRLLGRLLGS